MACPEVTRDGGPVALAGANVSGCERRWEAPKGVEERAAVDCPLHPLFQRT